MKMNDATIIGSTIWADLVREILKPTSLLNQALFPLTATNTQLLTGVGGTLHLPIRLPLPTLQRDAPRSIYKSFLIEDILRGAAPNIARAAQNSARAAPNIARASPNIARAAQNSAREVRSNTCDMVMKTCDSLVDRSQQSHGKACPPKSYISKCSGSLVESIEAEFQRRSLRKERTVFTKSQLSKLKARFCYQKYLSSEERAQLACALALTEEQVQRWFQNRRAKVKRQESNTAPADDKHAKLEKCNELQSLVSQLSNHGNQRSDQKRTLSNHGNLLNVHSNGLEFISSLANKT